jgi:hypothetical protein
MTAGWAGFSALLSEQPLIERVASQVKVLSDITQDA